MIKKNLYLIIFGIFLLSLPFCLSEQVLWDDDSDIEIYDTWRDIDGNPLTGADCSWYVYDSDGTINQNGDALEFSVGIFNFSVSSLAIGIYPLRINCSKGGFNGTSSKDSIKIIDELSEEYKQRLEEINQTTHDIYDMLVDDINISLTNLLSITNLTYNMTLNLEADIIALDDSLTSLATYLRNKWGNEDADKMMDKIKEIRRDVTYLRSRYFYFSEETRTAMLSSMRKDGQEALNILYGIIKFWEKALIFIVPGGIILIFIIVICLITRKVRKKKKVEEDFNGEEYG